MIKIAVKLSLAVGTAATLALGLPLASASATTDHGPTVRKSKSCHGKIKTRDTQWITTPDGLSTVKWKAGAYTWQISSNFKVHLGYSYKKRCKIAKKTLKSFYVEGMTYDQWYGYKATKKKTKWVNPEDHSSITIRIVRSF
ncbi:MAG: hypothetical protein WBB44_00770 [Candidatus Nanopelagicales bacterium]|nr:hypothetical protein [Candidatus Nanopelagicales bacterium]